MGFLATSSKSEVQQAPVAIPCCPKRSPDTAAAICSKKEIHLVHSLFLPPCVSARMRTNLVSFEKCHASSWKMEREIGIGVTELDTSRLNSTMKLDLTITIPGHWNMDPERKLYPGEPLQSMQLIFGKYISTLSSSHMNLFVFHQGVYDYGTFQWDHL